MQPEKLQGFGATCYVFAVLKFAEQKFKYFCIEVPRHACD